MKLKSICTAKTTINKTKRQPMECEKIFANDVSDKKLIFKLRQTHIAQHQKDKQPN